MDMNCAKTKVIPLCKKDLVEMLKLLLEMAQNGEINNMVASGFLSDDSVFTAVVDASIIEHHTLVSYLNASAITRTVRIDANLEEGLH